MKNKLLLTGLALGMSLSLFAQRNCGAQILREKHLEEHPELQQKIDATEQMTAEFVKNYKAASRLNPASEKSAVKDIPVVVHIIYRDASENYTDAEVQRAIDSLNADFRDANYDGWNNPSSYFLSITGDAQLNFVLATTDPDGNSTNGITRTAYPTGVEFSNTNYKMYYPEDGGVDNWDPYRYLNIYVCHYVDGNGGGGTPLGFAQFPDDLETYPNEDGVVVNSPVFPINPALDYNLGRTLTHEVGHYFNLSHIWGDATCGDDKVADTPTHEDIEGNTGCPSYPHNANSSCGTDAEGEMYMNYMDYVSDSCMYMFSEGQVARMQAALENTGRRGLWDASYTPSATAELIEEGISVYPNPAINQLTVQLPNGTKFATATVSNIMGQEMDVAYILNGNNIELNTQNLAKGVYTISITDNSQIWVTKFSKK